MSYTYRYPHAALTADNIIFGFDGQSLNVLLVKRGIEPEKDKWAFPGGFMNIDETIEECAMRELAEETGFKVNMLEESGVYSTVDRDPRERVVTVAFIALVRYDENVKGGDDAKEARWFNIKELPPLAFDHEKILKDAKQKLKDNLKLYPISFALLPKEFSMPELQRLYEAVMDKEYDRRNFSRKMKDTGYIKAIGEKEENLRNIRYRFDKQKYEKESEDNPFNFSI